MFKILIKVFLLFVVYDLSKCCRSLAVITDSKHSSERVKRALHSNQNIRFTDLSLSISDQNFADVCLPQFRCNPAERYRSINGICNNLLVPGWGIPQTAYVRLAPASYADRLSQIRIAQNGNPLPSPRLIHTILFPEDDQFDFKHTLAVMEWGQFLAHDATFLSIKKGPACCAQDGTLLPFRDLHPACLPVPMPQNDPFYFRFGRTCIDMKRASVSEDLGCKLFPVQQISGVTHFIDGSAIYGSSTEVANSLRAFRGGLLRAQVTPDGRPFLANTNRPSQVCNVPSDAEVCYVAGDGRVNQNTEIAVTQVMFMRFHNLVAHQLNLLNPVWSDEILFQETRRIVIATLQHITYSEYLPIILGANFMRSSNLAPGRSGFANGYDEGMNPSTINEFVAAAFRSFHSTIQGSISLVSENRTLISQLTFSDWMNRPGIIQVPGNFDNFLRGLITQPQQLQDHVFNSEVSNFLFKSGGSFGNDLLSMDIMRGRDFGVPPYTTMRVVCGLPPVNNFEDLKDVMEEEKIVRLAKVYSSVHDVDYIVGGLLERRVPGAVTSPSFHCVLAEAFYRYKFADRFFYEFTGHPGSFTLEQLNTIRRFSFAMIICLASDNVQFAQLNGMSAPHHQSNPLIPCSDIVSAFNLKAWAV